MSAERPIAATDLTTVAVDAPARRLVLVVDDDELLQEAIGTALLLAGYEVLSAPNGARALDLLDTARPDLILLDLDMPVMGGREFAAAYHDRPSPHVPIVLITASPELHNTAAAIGAAGHLAKPFSHQRLLELIGGLEDGSEGQ